MFSWMARLFRAVATLVGLLLGYGLYGLIVVPLVEPAAAEHATQSASTEELSHAASAVSRQRDTLRAWFRPGDWELKSSKILENSRGKLLFETYRHLGGGRVLLQPCTLIFVPSRGGMTDEQRQREAILLRAPGGAVLQFQEPFDLTRGKIGQLQGGKLNGKILITSDRTDPGPEDNLTIEGRDLVLAGNRITSLQAVRFQLGLNQGSGRELVIELQPTADASASPQGGAAWDGIRSFELRRDVRMFVHMGGRGLLPAADDKPMPAQPTPQQQPVDVSCQGAFLFDFERRLATFQEAVEVVRLQPDGANDDLRCELLSIHFATKGDDPGAHNGRKMPQLEPDWIEARGNPLTVHSPAAGAQARGQGLKYEIASRAVTLVDAQEAIFVRGQDEIHAPQIHFIPAAAGHQHVFHASGPGWLRGIVPPRPNQPDAPPRPFAARWKSAVRFRPHEGQTVLSVEGEAHIEATEFGTLDAATIHAWLREKPRAAALAHQAAPPTQLALERMLAEGQVRLATPRFSAAAQTLKAWVLDHTPVPDASRDELPAPVPLAVAPPVQSPAPGMPPQAADVFPNPAVAQDPLAADRRFHIDAEILQVELTVTGSQVQLSRANAQRQVQLIESHTFPPEERPLIVRGDDLELTQQETAVVHVRGQPAHVEGRGLSLDGPLVRLDRAANRLSVDGAGQMRLPIERNAALQLPAEAAGQALEVRWQEAMEFDGQLAEFRREVFARLADQTLSTENLQVFLQGRVDFQNPPRDERPQVERLVCQGGALLDRLVHDAAGRLSDERLRVDSLSVNHITGVIESPGPGWLTSIRRADGAPGLAIPGQPAQAPAEPAGPLRFLGVRFERGVLGNLHHRELSFRQRVRAIYGSVAQWDDVIDVDADPTGNMLSLTCDELTVSQTPAAPQTPPASEMQAAGNAIVESQSFAARADRVRYSEAKQMLVLEGNGRSDAVLERQQVPGGAPQTVAARKFNYWPATGKWQIVDGSSIAAPGLPGRR